MVKVIYNSKTQTKEEITILNKKINNFLENYEIEGSNGEAYIKSRFGSEGIVISPIKGSEIELINQKPWGLGKLISSTPKSLKLEVNNTLYTIIFNPENN